MLVSESARVPSRSKAISLKVVRMGRGYSTF